ncbi:hypothetical protein AMS68_004879 [Peltaster fructicola]|uniref:Uncharacterized protein n=1 Tax=Peltaster fructicola TaxID=286661 RepID=A0A6H0XX61_9PEZI|nr:hypothetical protein AMS68_004879 [Peltaster fructicola]
MATPPFRIGLFDFERSPQLPAYPRRTLVRARSDSNAGSMCSPNNTDASSTLQQALLNQHNPADDARPDVDAALDNDFTESTVEPPTMSLPDSTVFRQPIPPPQRPSITVTPQIDNPPINDNAGLTTGEYQHDSPPSRAHLSVNTQLVDVTWPVEQSTLAASTDSAPYSTFRDRSGSTSSTNPLPCINCQKTGPGRVRCNVCKELFCMDCWNTQIPHWKAPMPGAIPHEKTEDVLFAKVQNCLYPAWDAVARDSAHEQDDSTTWFGVVQDDPYPVFRDYGKYRDIIGSARDVIQDQASISPLRDQAPMSPFLENAGESLYPTVTSFVGQTGAGKSTLIKLLIDLQSDDIEQMPSPVVGDSSSFNPTSDNVHLYLAPGSSGTRVRLYADCEGLEGGERDPASARVKAEKRKQAEEERRKAGRGPRQRYATERDLTWATTAAKRTREYFVKHLYPRVLYTFSDVVVFVHRNPKYVYPDEISPQLTYPRTIEGVFSLLLSWANAAIQTSSNQPVLPHAIIVFNAMDHNTPEERWDPDTATSRVLESMADCVSNPTFKRYTAFWESRDKRIHDFKHLLESFYGSIKVVYVPTGDRPNLLKVQLQRLHDLIHHASNTALEKKAVLRMLSDSEEFDSFLVRAFDHFACNFEKPFDFVQASFARSPVPNNFAGNIMKLACQVMDRWPRKGGHNIFDELSYLIASCIMLDVTRNKIKGKC